MDSRCSKRGLGLVARLVENTKPFSFVVRAGSFDIAGKAGTTPELQVLFGSDSS